MPVSALFANANQRASLKAGDIIFREGDVDEHMFGVIDGEVELRHGERVVTALGPGEVFGEMAIVDRSPRSLTAVAKVDTTLAFIDRRAFLFLVHETPTFALDVMAAMAKRLRDLSP